MNLPLRANIPSGPPRLVDPKLMDVLRTAYEVGSGVVKGMYESAKLPGDILSGKKGLDEVSADDALGFVLNWGGTTTALNKGGGVGLWRQRGRKFRASESLIKELGEKAINTSYEPFAGSAAWTSEIMKRGQVNAIRVGDLNRDVINIFQQVKKDPDGIARAVKRALNERDAMSLAIGDKEASKKLYIELRDRSLSARERAIKQLALGNRVWGYEPGGTVRGWPRKGNFSPAERVVEQIEFTGRKLQEVESDIAYRGYGKTLRGAGKGDFIFSDSPYMGGQSRYKSGNWSLSDEVELGNLLRVAEERGASGVLFNYQEAIPHHEYIKDWRSTGKLSGQVVGRFGDIWKK